MQCRHGSPNPQHMWLQGLKTIPTWHFKTPCSWTKLQAEAWHGLAKALRKETHALRALYEKAQCARISAIQILEQKQQAIIWNHQLSHHCHTIGVTARVVADVVEDVGVNIAVLATRKQV